MSKFECKHTSGCDFRVILDLDLMHRHTVHQWRQGKLLFDSSSCFLSVYVVVYFIVVQTLRCITRPLPPPFPFLFLFLLPSERPPIGFGGGRRLCRIIMGSSWENCPWKGWSEKKKRKIWSCFRSFSETCLEGSGPIGVSIQSLAGSLCHCQNLQRWGHVSGVHGVVKMPFFCCTLQMHIYRNCSFAII